MKSNPKISAAVAAILSAPATAVVAAAPADTSVSSAGSELQEVIVTAERRSESIQNVPITIQALTSETLSQLNVSTIEDYIKYVPGVSTGTLGPGQGNVFMRGLSTGVLGVQGDASVGRFPNVSVYLDDQSALLPGRNLDIYAADLERVEILEGPQGTLFGAGAQAGVIRYITNKPKLDRTEFNSTASYGTTAHGDPNSSLEAVLNLPLIRDKLAVRGVVYNDSRGGYINNIGSELHRLPTDGGFTAYHAAVPNDSIVANNFDLTGNAINPLTYKGLRLSALYKVNDEWDVLLQQSYQNINAQGVFFQMPRGSDGQALAPLSVTLFAPSSNRDRFTNTALTVNGRIGELRAVYSGAYLVRNYDNIGDYTNYSRARYGDYYQCVGFSPDPTKGKCYSPVATWHDSGRNTHQTHEIRLSTPDAWRLRGIGGVFYEKYVINDETDWLYRTVPNCGAGTFDFNCFLPIVPPPDQFANNPNVRGPHEGFFDDFQRTVDQKAAFASLDFDIIPQVLTITGGTRYFKLNNESIGGNVFSFGCEVTKKPLVPNPDFCTAYVGSNLGKQDPHTLKSSGFRSRGNLSWHVVPDALVYYTWSQGFRLGGFNRGTAKELPDAQGNPQFLKPKSYVSDDLTNNEIGWKTQWFGHRLQVNGAIYQEDWKNVQVGFFCPACGLGNLTFNTNGPDYRVKGVEIELVARVTDGLTIQGSASWNSSNLVNSPNLVDNVPGSPNFGKPITTWCDPASIKITGVCTPKQLINLYGAPGTPLAESPSFQANLRARYEWAVGKYQAFWQIGGARSAGSFSETGNTAPFRMPDWTVYDGAIGMSKDAWNLELFGQNLTNVNRSLFTSSRQQIVTETPMRPRVLGIRFGYKFAE